MELTALSAAAADNLAAHATWAQQRTPGMRVLDVAGVAAGDSGLRCDTFSVVSRARLSRADAARAVAAVLAHFRAEGRPFSWWVGPGDEPTDLGETLAAHGLAADESEVAMAVDLARPTPADGAPAASGAPGALGELRITRATTAALLANFAAVNAANWDPPDVDVLTFYDRASPVLLGSDSPLCYWVGYVDERPVAAVETAFAGSVAGIYNVSTLAAFRRRGIGAAMVRHALDEARARGYRTAILQAARGAVGLYERAGFVAFGEFTEYKPRG
jgi:ribosomal protein S18 acetylase RimI-like enzyme